MLQPSHIDATAVGLLARLVRVRDVKDAWLLRRYLARIYPLAWVVRQLRGRCLVGDGFLGNFARVTLVQCCFYCILKTSPLTVII